MKFANLTRSLILELAELKYSSQWTRIAGMQQSAASLVTLLAIIFTVLGAFGPRSLSGLKESPAVSELEAMLTGFMLFFLAVSFYNLIQVLTEKKAKDVRSPLSIYRWLNGIYSRSIHRKNDSESALNECIVALITVVDRSVSSLQKALERNQKYYSRSLKSVTCTLLTLSLWIAVYAGRNIEPEYYYIALRHSILLLGILGVIYILSPFKGAYRLCKRKLSKKSNQ